MKETIQKDVSIINKDVFSTFAVQKEKVLSKKLHPIMPIMTPGSGNTPRRVIKKMVVLDSTKIKNLGLEDKIAKVANKLNVKSSLQQMENSTINVMNNASNKKSPISSTDVKNLLNRKILEKVKRNATSATVTKYESKVSQDLIQNMQEIMTYKLTKLKTSTPTQTSKVQTGVEFSLNKKEQDDLVKNPIILNQILPKLSTLHPNVISNPTILTKLKNKSKNKKCPKYIGNILEANEKLSKPPRTINKELMKTKKKKLISQEIRTESLVQDQRDFHGFTENEIKSDYGKLRGLSKLIDLSKMPEDNDDINENLSTENKNMKKRKILVVRKIDNQFEITEPDDFNIIQNVQNFDILANRKQILAPLKIMKPITSLKMAKSKDVIKISKKKEKVEVPSKGDEEDQDKSSLGKISSNNQSGNDQDMSKKNVHINSSIMSTTNRETSPLILLNQELESLKPKVQIHSIENVTVPELTTITSSLDYKEILNTIMTPTNELNKTINALDNEIHNNKNISDNCLISNTTECLLKNVKENDAVEYILKIGDSFNYKSDIIDDSEFEDDDLCEDMFHDDGNIECDYKNIVKEFGEKKYSTNNFNLRQQISEKNSEPSTSFSSLQKNANVSNICREDMEIPKLFHENIPVIIEEFIDPPTQELESILIEFKDQSNNEKEIEIEKFDLLRTSLAEDVVQSIQKYSSISSPAITEIRETCLNNIRANEENNEYVNNIANKKEIIENLDIQSKENDITLKSEQIANKSIQKLTKKKNFVIKPKLKRSVKSGSQITEKSKTNLKQTDESSKLLNEQIDSNSIIKDVLLNAEIMNSSKIDQKMQEVFTENKSEMIKISTENQMDSDRACTESPQSDIVTKKNYKEEIQELSNENDKSISSDLNENQKTVGLSFTRKYKPILQNRFTKNDIKIRKIKESTEQELTVDKEMEQIEEKGDNQVQMNSPICSMQIAMQSEDGKLIKECNFIENNAAEYPINFNKICLTEFPESNKGNINLLLKLETVGNNQTNFVQDNTDDNNEFCDQLKPNKDELIKDSSGGYSKDIEYIIEEYETKYDRTKKILSNAEFQIQSNNLPMECNHDEIKENNFLIQEETRNNKEILGIVSKIPEDISNRNELKDKIKSDLISLFSNVQNSSDCELNENDCGGKKDIFEASKTNSRIKDAKNKDPDIKNTIHSEIDKLDKTSHKIIENNEISPNFDETNNPAIILNNKRRDVLNSKQNENKNNQKNAELKNEKCINSQEQVIKEKQTEHASNIKNKFIEIDLKTDKLNTDEITEKAKDYSRLESFNKYASNVTTSKRVCKRKSLAKHKGKKFKIDHELSTFDKDFKQKSIIMEKCNFDQKGLNELEFESNDQLNVKEEIFDTDEKISEVILEETKDDIIVEKRRHRPNPKFSGEYIYDKKYISNSNRDLKNNKQKIKNKRNYRKSIIIEKYNLDQNTEFNPISDFNMPESNADKIFENKFEGTEKDLENRDVETPSKECSKNQPLDHKLSTILCHPKKRKSILDISNEDVYPVKKKNRKIINKISDDDGKESSIENNIQSEIKDFHENTTEILPDSIQTISIDISKKRNRKSGPKLHENKANKNGTKTNHIEENIENKQREMLLELSQSTKIEDPKKEKKKQNERISKDKKNSSEINLKEIKVTNFVENTKNCKEKSSKSIDRVLRKLGPKPKRIILEDENRDENNSVKILQEPESKDLENQLAMPSASSKGSQIEIRRKREQVKAFMSDDENNGDSKLDSVRNSELNLDSIQNTSIPKKRGRKPKQKLPTDKIKAEQTEPKIRKSEKFIHPKLLIIRDRAELNDDGPVLPMKNIPKGSVRCGLCKEITKPSSWVKHIGTHYGVGWKDGIEQPINLTSYCCILKNIMNFKKKHKNQPLLCRLCNEEKKSALGILEHILRCNLTEEEEMNLKKLCEFCQNLFKCMPQHLKICLSNPDNLKFRNDDNEDGNKNEDVIFSEAGRQKRKSVIKAEKMLKEVGEDLKHAMGDDLVKPYTEYSVGHLMKWKKEIRITGKAKCTGKKCKFSSESLNQMKKHIRSCKLLLHGGFICVRCKFHHINESIVKKHALKKHDIESKDFEESGSEAAIDSESSDSDNSGVDENDIDDDGVEDENVENNGVEKSLLKNCNTKSSTTYTADIYLGDRNTSIEMVQKWLQQFRISNYSDNILYKYASPIINELSENELNVYQQYNHESMQFSFVNVRDINTEIGKCYKNLNWQQIKSLENDSNENEFLLFCGGPITALSWIPVPRTESCQYLSVAIKMNAQCYTKIVNPKFEQSLILINKIENESIQSTTQHYAISYDCGPIHDMVYLPSGGYSEELNRLGLIAIASTECDINIFSLPLKAPQNCDKMRNNYCFINVKPIIKLILDISNNWNNTDCLKSQCLKIVWSEATGHDYIIGGFSNGFVGIWHINENDNLNKFEKDGIIYFLPISYFQSTVYCIKDVQLHYDMNGPRWILVSSQSRECKIYDLCDITSPILLSEIEQLRSIAVTAWPIYWQNPLIGICKEYVLNPVGIAAWSPMNIMFKLAYSITTSSGFCAISFNPWFNLLLCGSENGDISIHRFRNTTIDHNGKNHKHKRYLYYTDIVRLDGKEIPKITKNIKLNNENLEILEVSDPDYKKKYGLVLSNVINCTASMRKKFASHNRNPPMQLKSYTKVNRVACNTNDKGKMLFAVGYENGFCRIMSLAKEMFSD